MIEVYPNLFVGSKLDFYLLCEKDWYVITASNQVHHDLLGWLDKNHPNYHFVQFDSRLILNLIDAREERLIAKQCIDVALNFIRTHSDRKILLHCNLGRSRSPGIAFLYLASLGILDKQFHKAITQFRKIYPEFWPGEGIYRFLEKNYLEYQSGKL